LTWLDPSKYAQLETLLRFSTGLTITLNGEPYELQEPLTLAALLQTLQIDPRRVAVEHNLTVVKRARYADTVVAHGDRIEIVNFVGGGSAEDSYR
jgi:thiamine biosynthesis protein ThiS